MVQDLTVSKVLICKPSSEYVSHLLCCLFSFVYVSYLGVEIISDSLMYAMKQTETKVFRRFYRALTFPSMSSNACLHAHFVQTAVLSRLMHRM